MKTLSKNKQRFIGIVKAVNQQLNPEFRLSREQAIEMYDREISPYGYPTNQSILTREGMAMFQYNQAVIERTKLNKASKDLAGGEGFGYNTSVGNLCPNYYVTKDLADSLIETKTPEGKPDLIHHEVMPVIKVVFPKDHSEISTIAIQQRPYNHTMQQHENGIWVRVCFWQLAGKDFKEKIYVDIDYFIPLDGTGHCMMCDTREYFKKNLLEKNWTRIKYATQPENIKYLPKRVGKDYIAISQISPVHIEDEEIKDLIHRFLKGLDVSYNFVINLLCLLTHEPEIITVQKSASKYIDTKSRGFSSEKVNNVPNVHWLGEHFTTRVVDSTPKDGEPQVGKPKKSHWRRGHWHTILQGPGRTQKTMRWFKPTFIRGHKQTEEVSK